jgi:hypothetical protein
MTSSKLAIVSIGNVPRGYQKMNSQQLKVGRKGLDALGGGNPLFSFSFGPRVFRVFRVLS